MTGSSELLQARWQHHRLPSSLVIPWASSEVLPSAVKGREVGDLRSFLDMATGRLVLQERGVTVSTNAGNNEVAGLVRRVYTLFSTVTKCSPLDRHLRKNRGLDPHQGY